MAHTPGPWVKNRNGDLIGSDGKRVVMYGLSASFCLCDPTDEQRANAILAEAAPDLLEAAKAIYAGVVSGDGDGRINMNVSREAFKAIEAAIAKAEGK